MKRTFCLFIALFYLVQCPAAIAAETINSKPAMEAQNRSSSKVPDFSPPTDLTGPVFPLEDLVPPPNEDTSRFLSEFMNMLATLGLVLCFILIAAWFLKRMLNTRMEQANVSSLIKVIERRALSPKTAIYLLEIQGKTLIISETAHGVTRLDSYNSPEEEEAANLPSAFNKLLDKPSQPS